jgi:hypothetical protein
VNRIIATAGHHQTLFPSIIVANNASKALVHQPHKQ